MRLDGSTLPTILSPTGSFAADVEFDPAWNGSELALAWEDARGAMGTSPFYAISSDLLAFAPEEALSATVGPSIAPTMDALADGFVVAWEDQSAATPSIRYAVRSTRLTTEVGLATTSADHDPSIALAPAGLGIVSVHEQGPDLELHFQSLTPTLDGTLHTPRAVGDRSVPGTEPTSG